MTKLMTVPLNVRIDSETNGMLNEMSKHSDRAKIVRQAIQVLYSQWPIVKVPTRKLSEFNEMLRQERKQEGEE